MSSPSVVKYVKVRDESIKNYNTGSYRNIQNNILTFLQAWYKSQVCVKIATGNSSIQAQTAPE